MATTQEVINQGIAEVLKEPDRDFSKHPLTQEEITSVIETLVQEVNNPNLDEDLSRYYLSVITFLKTKIFYN